MLSPLAVAPDHQRQGIGGRLLAQVPDVAERRGAPLVFLEGAPDYYGSRGWSAASVHGLEHPSRRIPEPACQVLLPGRHEPWMTGRLVYPDVWWRLDLVGLRDPDLAEIEKALGSGWRSNTCSICWWCPHTPTPSAADAAAGHAGVAPGARRGRCAPPMRPTGRSPRPAGCSTCARPTTAASPACADTSWSSLVSPCSTSRHSRLATRRGLSEIRGDLKDVADEAVVLAAVQTFQLEDARPARRTTRGGAGRGRPAGRRYRVRIVSGR